jgi:hypothetical protein
MSRLDKLKEQHKDLNINLIDLLSKADPSTTYKYLPFIIKMFKSNFATDGDVLRHLFQRDNLNNLHKFEEHLKANRIKNNDIGMYSSFKQIADEVRDADELVRLKELEKQVKKIYNDDDWMILIPLSYEAAKMYGANTKWCVTQEKYWTQYIPDYKIIYIINKKNDKKWAISSKDHGILIEGWQANDEPINPFMIPIPSSLLAIITDEIRERDSIVDMNEYKEIHNIKPSSQEPLSTWKDYKEFELKEYWDAISDNNYEPLPGDSNRMEVFDVNNVLSIMHKLGMGGHFGGNSNI